MEGRNLAREAWALLPRRLLDTFTKTHVPKSGSEEDQHHKNENYVQHLSSLSLRSPANL